MAGLGILFGALSGAGKGLAQSAEQDQKVSDQMRLEAERSRLDEERTARIEEARAQRQRQAGVQQGQDIGSVVNQMQNQRDADAINAANAGVEGGSNISAADAQILRTQPAARQAYGLLNPTRQSDLEDRATAAEKLGYLDAAKETRNTLQTEITNQRNQSLDESMNKRLDQQAEANKISQEYQNRREDRLDRLASAQMAFSQARANKEDARADQMAEREQRQATAAAMKGAETDIKGLQKEMADPMLAPEQKQVLQNQLDLARSDARRFRASLGGAGIEGSGPKAGTPDALWSILNGGKSVAGNGKQGGTIVPKPVQTDNVVKDNSTATMQKPTPAPSRSAAQIRGNVETRKLRGQKTQYQNPKTGEWFDSMAEATKDL